MQSHQRQWRETQCITSDGLLQKPLLSFSYDLVDWTAAMNCHCKCDETEHFAALALICRFADIALELFFCSAAISIG